MKLKKHMLKIIKIILSQLNLVFQSTHKKQERKYGSSFLSSYACHIQNKKLQYNVKMIGRKKDCSNTENKFLLKD